MGTSKKKVLIIIAIVVAMVIVLVGVYCWLVVSLMLSRQYEPDILISSPDDRHELVVREWSCLGGGGVDIYIRKTEWYNMWNKKEIESAVTDDYYHPFTAGAYEVEWESDQVTVRYCEGLEIENVKDPSTWRGLVIYALN